MTHEQTLNFIKIKNISNNLKYKTHKNALKKRFYVYIVNMAKYLWRQSSELVSSKKILYSTFLNIKIKNHRLILNKIIIILLLLLDDRSNTTYSDTHEHQYQ